MKISELSKELGATSKDIIALANDLGIECKAATKNLSDEEMQTVKNAFLKKSGAKEEKPAKTEKKESTKAAKAEPAKAEIVKEEAKAEAKSAPKAEKKAEPVKAAEGRYRARTRCRCCLSSRNRDTAARRG